MIEEQLKGKKADSAKMSRELAITEKKMNDKVFVANEIKIVTLAILRSL